MALFGLTAAEQRLSGWLSLAVYASYQVRNARFLSWQIQMLSSLEQKHFGRRARKPWKHGPKTSLSRAGFPVAWTSLSCISQRCKLTLWVGRLWDIHCHRGGKPILSFPQFTKPTCKLASRCAILHSHRHPEDITDGTEGISSPWICSWWTNPYICWDFQAY